MRELRSRLKGEEGQVYTYVVETVKQVDGELLQSGSGPNFQGDLITLCTCKHQLRAYLPAEEWPGTWVAGFTSSRNGAGPNKLFYLMQVGEAYSSQYELWNSDTISTEAKLAKLVSDYSYGESVHAPKESSRPLQSK